MQTVNSVHHGPPWGFFWQPVPVPATTLTCTYRDGISWVWVREFTQAGGLHGSPRVDNYYYYCIV